jgi:hypothetical protein
MSINYTQLKNRLWSAADELRANSRLRSYEYSVPVLGLIFLRYADFGAPPRHVCLAIEGHLSTVGGRDETFELLVVCEIHSGGRTHHKDKNGISRFSHKLVYVR